MIRKSNMLLPVEARAKIKLLCDDFELWAENACKIRTEHEGVIPLKLKPVQRRFVEFCHKQLAEEGHIRVVIVKGRQMGLSTIVSAFLYHRLMQSHGKRGLVMAHSTAASNELFNMYKMINDELPPILQPVTKVSNQNEFRFSELSSSMYKATSGGLDLRGQTFQYAHLSEVSFWEPSKAGDMMAALSEAIPTGKGTIMILESTAKGCVGPYYDYARLAAANQAGFRLFFSAWFEEEKKYFEKAPDDWVMNLEEEEYATRHSLSRDRMRWRHNKIKTNGDRRFKEEYPATPEEAFQTTGGQVFDQEGLNYQRHNALPKIGQCRIDYTKDVLTIDAECPYGELLVYKAKSKGESYTIGADTALGIDGKDRDFSVAQILDGNAEQVAIWRGKADPHDFGKILDFLGRQYNNARLIVEANNHGGSVLWMLKQLSYPNVYQNVVDKQVTDKRTNDLGFNTTRSAKDKIIDRLRAAIRTREIKINDPTTLDELQAFVATEKGRMEASPGHHDDCVMSLALALHDLDRSYAPIDGGSFADEYVYGWSRAGVEDDATANRSIPERYRPSLAKLWPNHPAFDPTHPRHGEYNHK